MTAEGVWLSVTGLISVALLVSDHDAHITFLCVFLLAVISTRGAYVVFDSSLCALHEVMTGC
jgi:hypothetical protein